MSTIWSSNSSTKSRHYRRVVIRYEYTALSFASILLPVAAMIWLR